MGRMQRFPLAATSLLIFIGSLAAVPARTQTPAQQALRQATITVDTGSSGGGKCTLEVIINGTAEIDVLGPTADLRSLTGEPLGWRRFECTGVLPPNPDEFTLHRISGRGKMDLTRHPLLDGGGPVMLRLKSSQLYPEVFVIEIAWTGRYDGTNHSWRPRS